MNGGPSKDFGSPGNRDVVLDPGVFYVCQRCNASAVLPETAALHVLAVGAVGVMPLAVMSRAATGLEALPRPRVRNDYY